jgi:2,4-dienoyl-CoA reductase-like NADH-dependent reductase (Old Yellow Enzyme family)
MVDLMPTLFDQFKLKDVTLRNRIVASPMCQYVAEDGIVTDWHKVHYASLARGGSALVIVEASAVSKEGRITPGDLGIWNDAQADALRTIVSSIKQAGAVPGIQLAHAGRKASANRPWEGDDHMAEDDPRAWSTIAPSAIAWGVGLRRTPAEISKADIARVRDDFAAAAGRARDAGFEWLELHFAHGYLAPSFWSIHSNQRTDEYGGSAENRGRFLLETLKAVRKVWPEHLPLTVRLASIEFDGRDEEVVQESIELALKMKAEGLDLLDVSMNFSTPEAKIPWGPLMLADVTARMRRETGLPTATSWNIINPANAEKIVREGAVDLVFLGRALLANPHWPYAAAIALGVERPSWTLPAPYAHWLERYAIA